MDIQRSQLGLPVILSVSNPEPSSLDDIATLCATLAPVVLHTSALTIAPRSADRKALGRLKKIARDGGITFWNGGYRAASAALLTTGELDWERAWGATNRWGTGFGSLLDLSVSALFFDGLTPERAEVLAARTGLPVCAGYAGANAPLALFVNTSWKSITTARVRHDAPSIDRDGCDAIHIVFAPGSSETLLSRSREIAAKYRRTEEGSPFQDHGGRVIPSMAYSINGDKPPSLPIVVRSATIHRCRKTVSGVHERSQTVLDRAALTSVPRADTDDSHSDVVRELQGMTSGITEIRDGTVEARFAAGRPAGLTIGGTEVLPPIRAQGWARSQSIRRPPTTWLQNTAGAWFTTYENRGIQESAQLEIGTTGSKIDIAVRSTVPDSYPALHLGVDVSFPAEIPPGQWSIEPLQFPIARMTAEVPITIDVHGADMVGRRTSITLDSLPRTFVASSVGFEIEGRRSIWTVAGNASVAAFTLSCSSVGRRRHAHHVVWLSPVFSIVGEIPEYLADTVLATSFVIGTGAIDPIELLRLAPSGAESLVWRISNAR